MTYIYNIIDYLLPFSCFSHQFMKNSLLAILLIGPIFGFMGTMIVNNGMEFFSDAIGHSVFTGLAIGTVLGIYDVNVSSLVFSIFFAIAITFIRTKSQISQTTLISIVASIAVAFGIAILSYEGSFKKYSSYLIGDLLSINNTDLYQLTVIFMLTFIILFITFNKLFISSISLSLAKSRNINTVVYEMIFAILVAIIVTMTMKWIGLLLLNSLLVLPAATAKNISKNMRQYHILSSCISISAGLIGLISSYYVNISSGAAIVLISGLLFIISFFLKVH